MQDTKINKCDSCKKRSTFPKCCYYSKVEFGDGYGNDNIIKCVDYEKDKTWRENE